MQNVDITPKQPAKLPNNNGFPMAIRIMVTHILVHHCRSRHGPPLVHPQDVRGAHKDEATEGDP